MNIAKFVSEVQDLRKARGKQYSASSIINLMLAGLMSNRNSIKAIHRFAESLNQSERERFGFINGKIPCYSNLTIILQKIDIQSLKDVNAELLDVLGCKTEQSDIEARLSHIDGKKLRNSDSFGVKTKAGILTAFSSSLKGVLDFVSIKGGDEYGAMLDLLSKADLNNKIITADAGFCHEEICAKIVDNMADFAFTLKGNEGNLHYFANKAFESAGVEARRFEGAWDLVHGRIERRSIEVIEMPFEYLNGFMYIKQICKITREREYKGKNKECTKESALMITSLGGEYGPEILLDINRKHWNCENNLNWIKDAIFLEDKTTVSTGVAPIIMSCLRNMAIAILNSFSQKITETREMFNNSKLKLLRLFRAPLHDF